MAKQFFSQSPDMKQEYCASIVRIGEVKPIEGSDFLGVTLVNGIEVVVRKDAVHEGDIMFFAPQETALNLRFLAVNNQFEMGDYELNANVTEVKALIDADKRDEARQMVGYFNKRGRVRAMKLRGIYSKGFLISPDMMANYQPKVVSLNLDELVGTDFDMVGDEQFVAHHVKVRTDQFVQIQTRHFRLIVRHHVR